MNKIEELLMRVSRVFGVVVLALTLLAMTVTAVILLTGYIGRAFSTDEPVVTFNRSDFFIERNSDNGASVTVRGVYSRRITDGLRDSYVARLKRFTSENSAKLFNVSGDSEAQRNGYIAAKTAAFVSSSEKSIDLFLSENIDSGRYAAFVNSLLAYFREAEKAGVDLWMDGGYVVSNIYSSRVYAIFTDEYLRQYRQLGTKQKEGDWQELVTNAAIYGVLFILITIFLFVSVMFAILRIEKKIR